MFFQVWNKFQGSNVEIEAPESKIFFNFGMKFQGSKPEIEAPESKTYGKMCVFLILE